jgi:hypothetical protein
MRLINVDGQPIALIEAQKSSKEVYVKYKEYKGQDKTDSINEQLIPIEH